MTLSAFITVITGHDKPQPPGCLPAVSSVWRIGGQFRRDGFAYVVLVNNAGRIRTEALSSFTFEGLLMSGYIDGEQVTVYSGSVKSGGAQ